MRENDNEFGHYVPLLRRIIILVAVITAIPVVLWTITAVVRTYVGPPKIPTFHQLAARASINEPSDAKPVETAAPEPTVRQAKLADPSPATATDTRSDAAAPKGPLLGERPPDNDVTTAATVPAVVPATASPPKAADPSIGVTPRIVEIPAAAPDATTASMTAAAAPPPDTASASEAMPAATPLSGPIPLPRRRPHVVAEAQTEATPASQTAPTTRMASATPSSGTGIPMPRPRPEAAPSAPAPEGSSGGPLDFITNMFGGNK